MNTDSLAIGKFNNFLMAAILNGLLREGLVVGWRMVLWQDARSDYRRQVVDEADVK